MYDYTALLKHKPRTESRSVQLIYAYTKRIRTAATAQHFKNNFERNLVIEVLRTFRLAAIQYHMLTYF